MSKGYTNLDEWGFNKDIVKPKKNIELVGYLKDHGWETKDVGKIFEIASASEIWKQLKQKSIEQD